MRLLALWPCLVILIALAVRTTLAQSMGIAYDSVRALACSHVSRTGRFVYACQFETVEGCLAAMASLNVSSCFQVPRGTCYSSLIGGVYIMISSAPDGKHRVEIFLDSQCAITSEFSETQGDFACFNIGVVCADLKFMLCRSQFLFAVVFKRFDDRQQCLRSSPAGPCNHCTTPNHYYCTSNKFILLYFPVTHSLRLPCAGGVQSSASWVLQPHGQLAC